MIIESIENDMLEMDKKRKAYSFSLFGVCVWAHYYYKRFGWVRLFGVGLKFKDTSIHPLIFSEKYGKHKGIQISKWHIGWLPEK